MSELGYLKEKDNSMLLKIRKRENNVNSKKKMNKWASIGKCTKNTVDTIWNIGETGDIDGVTSKVGNKIVFKMVAIGLPRRQG